MSDIPDRKKWQRRQEELGRILSMPERAFVAGELKSRDEMNEECPGNDPTCPGHDHGDPCHYQGSDPMEIADE